MKKPRYLLKVFRTPEERQVHGHIASYVAIAPVNLEGVEGKTDSGQSFFGLLIEVVNGEWSYSSREDALRAFSQLLRDSHLFL
jgi:hypothetical protein